MKIEINGVRFLGSTLWTDFLLFGVSDKYFALQHVRKGMADFELIRYNGKPFTPEDSIRIHEQSRGWLEQMLAQSFDG